MGGGWVGGGERVRTWRRGDTLVGVALAQDEVPSLQSLNLGTHGEHWLEH